MAYEYESVTLFCKLDRLNVNLGDQRAGSINHAEVSTLAGVTHFGCDTVGRIDDTLPFGHFVDLVYKNGTLGAKVFDDMTVMNDLLADVDRRSEGVESDLHDIDGANHPGAESSWLEEKNGLGVV